MDKFRHPTVVGVALLKGHPRTGREGQRGSRGVAVLFI